MHHFKSLVHRYGVDIAALQEVCRKSDAPPMPHDSFEYRTADNLTFTDRRCGVATLSKFPIIETAAYLSGVKELGFATRKSALFTIHRLSSDHRVALLNLHAVNFVPTHLFALEMQRLEHWLSSHDHLPMIVAGDFNTWNRRRETILLELMNHYGFKQVQPASPHIKSLLGHPLDHIFYRDLQLVETEAPHIPVSDHNPIVARFLSL